MTNLSKLRRIVFWEPCVSPHKAALLSALAREGHLSVVCCAQDDLPSDRKALGWSMDISEGSVDTFIAPNESTIQGLVNTDIEGSLHIFSGLRWFYNIEAGLQAVKRSGAMFAVYSEPRDDQGWKGALRLLQSWAEECWVRRNVSFILAIGRHGPAWFSRVGYSAEIIHPFAYFLPEPKLDAVEIIEASSQLGCQEFNRLIRVGFVGRITITKGVFYLLDAIKCLDGKASLTLVGDGDARSKIVSLVQQSHLDVDMTGALPMASVQNKMEGFDVLVLPSITKDDGWGAVVSEALMLGCAVVATSCVGASILLDRSQNGRVVPPNDSKAIADAILQIRDSGLLSSESRTERSLWALQRLTASAGAKQLIRIIEHHRNDGQRPQPFFE